MKKITREEALAYLRREGQWADATTSPRPHLILLDLRLPRLDGFHVLQAIKETSELRAIPVVILTTSEAGPDVARAYEFVVPGAGRRAIFRFFANLGEPVIFVNNLLEKHSSRYYRRFVDFWETGEIDVDRIEQA